MKVAALVITVVTTLTTFAWKFPKTYSYYLKAVQVVVVAAFVYWHAFSMGGSITYTRAMQFVDYDKSKEFRDAVEPSWLLLLISPLCVPVLMLYLTMLANVHAIVARDAPNEPKAVEASDSQEPAS